MKYFTSDTHWGHSRVIEYSNRPYKDIDEMDEALISNWNAEVKPNDEVYHLGDVAFCQSDKLKSILQRLNGRKHLIWGNHDQVIQKDRSLQELFVWCRHYHEISIPSATDKYPLKIVLFHFPILEWNRGHHGAIHLHGHTHGKCKYPWGEAGEHGVVESKILDVGVDVQGYKPISVDRVIELVKDKPNITHS